MQEREHNSRISRKIKTIISIFLFIFALSFQLWNIDFGLPGHYEFEGEEVPFWYNDEEWINAQTKYYMTPTAQMFIFSHPPLQNFMVSAILLYDRIIHGEVPEDWKISIVSRVLSALFVAGSAVVLFFIGMEFGLTAGILSGFFFSISPITTWIGHDFKSEALSGLLLLLSIYCAIRCFRATDKKSFFRKIGLFSGLSSMASFLSVYFLHIPLVVYFACRKTMAFSNDNIGLDRVPKKTLHIIMNMILMTSVIGVVFVVANPLLKDGVFRMGEFLYNLQNSTTSFDQHANTLDFLYSKLIFAVFSLSILGLGCYGYIRFRDRIVRFSLLNGLGYLEIAYLRVALGIIIIMALGTILNPFSPFAFIETMGDLLYHTSSNYGHFGLYPDFPEIMMPTYFMDVLPKSLGMPLYLLSLAALLFFIARINRMRFALLIMFFPFWIKLLPMSGAMPSRWAYLGVFLFYIAIGFLFESINRKTGLWWKSAIGLVVSVTSIYTIIFTVGYIKTLDYDADGRIKAARWIVENIEKGTTIGIVNDDFILPHNLGPIGVLNDYELVDYKDMPEYCVIDGFEHHIMSQFFDLTQKGYVYSKGDWLPLHHLPNKKTVDISRKIYIEQDYEYLKTFPLETPKIWGTNFSYQYLDDTVSYMHRTVHIYKKKTNF